MNDFFKMDIFFFVTTMAVVLLTLLLAILIIYLIKITRKVNYITNKAKEQTELLADELTELRRGITTSGFRLKHFMSFFSNITKKSKK